MKSAPTPRKRLEDYANHAFHSQTFSSDDDATVYYVKPDVQEAHAAYLAFMSSKTHENLATLIAAVSTCVEYERSGFAHFQLALNQVKEKFDQSLRNETSLKSSK